MSANLEAVYRQLGKPGRYHVTIYILLCCNYFPVVINHLIMALFGAKTSYVCSQVSHQKVGHVPSHADFATNDSGLTDVDDSQSLTISMNSANLCFLSDNMSHSENVSTKCSEWNFTLENGENSIVTEFSLVCDRAYMSSLATTIYFLGVMIGGLVFGALSDRFGRKPFMLTTLYCHIAVGTGLAFVHNYVTFVTLRFLQGILMQGLQTSSFVLIMELFPPEHRTAVGTIVEVFWAFGIMWLAFLGWLLRDWRHIQLAVTLPSLFTIIYIWVIPESCRWLVTNDRTEDAVAILKKAAKFNRVTLPDDILSYDKYKQPDCDSESSTKHIKHYTVFDMFRTPMLRKRTLILFWVWMVVAMSYYGLSLSATSLAGNKYLNLFISGAVELPAYCAAVFILNKFGRRKPLCFYLIIGGVMCVAAGVVRSQITDIWWLSTLLALIGKFGMAGCFSVILLFTCELYPTVIRNVSVGACSFWARLGGVIAPQILFLGQLSNFGPLPVLIFGAASLSGAVLTLLLPETQHTQLPDTVLEAENMQQNDRSIETDIGVSLKLMTTDDT